MAQPPPTRLHIDPPIEQWRVTPRNGRATPIIATGHQPTLWHPGILAKYLATDAIAQHLGGSAVNVVVEHNALQAQILDVPQQHVDVLRVHRCLLAQARGDESIPPNVASPINAEYAVQRLDEEASFAAMTPAMGIYAGLRDLAETFDAIGDAQADQSSQLVSALDQLMRPYLSQPIEPCFTRHFVTSRFVDRLLTDPVECVRCYNRAAINYPEARIRTLYAGRDVVEVPLWAQDKATVTPVYADLGDSKRPQLFTILHNQHLDLNEPNAHRYLRPRAITLSAIMRSELCDLFIHGTGGGIYDQVTERWWQDWFGEELAPKAVVSADVFLPFEVPVATQQQRIKAQWYAHHLPNNIDRYTDASDEREAELRSEKRQLLDRMNDDRLKRRRAAAFKRIHAINDDLAAIHSHTLDQANQRAEDAHIGVTNHAIANRRDWCFALYPDAVLKGLAEQISARLLPSP